VVLGDRRWTAWLAAEQQHPTWLCQLYSAPDATVYHSIIISAVLGLIDYKAAYRIRKVNKLDFLACLGGLLSLFFIWKLQQGDNSPPDFIDHSSGNMITQEFTAIFCESLYGPGLHLASVHRKIKNSRPVINDFFCFSSAFWLSSDWPRLCRIELAALELGAHHGRRFHFSFSIAASNRGWWSAVLVVRNAADPLNAMQISSLKTWV
jgi:hypothetical protein